MQRAPNNNNAAPDKAAALPRALAPHAARVARRRRRQERALSVRGSAPAPPTAHRLVGGCVAGSAVRYCGADTVWNDRVRSFEPSSATAPRTWPVAAA